MYMIDSWIEYWHLNFLDRLAALGTDLKASCGLCPSMRSPISVDVCNQLIDAITIRVSATSMTVIHSLLPVEHTEKWNYKNLSDL